MLFDTFKMFIHLFIELIVLFIGISFIIYLIQSSLTAEKLQQLLGKRGIKRYVYATILGSVTPFCSCSTIPMLKGLINAKVSFGALMTFLFVSPLLNPLVVILLVKTFGVAITSTYALMAIFIAILTSILLEKANFARYIINNNQKSNQSCSKDTCSENNSNKREKMLSLSNIKRSWTSSINDFKNIFVILTIGVVIGAIIHGFVPSDLIIKYAGADNPLAIIVAAIIGIPLYIRVIAMIPLSSVLIAKGIGLGALISLIIGSAGASLTEVILLRSLFKTKLIIAFLLVVLTMAISTGFMVNIFFS